MGKTKKESEWSLMKIDAINGNEIQIEGFRIACHVDDEHDAIASQVQYKLKRIFKGEKGNKIIRATWQKGTKVFFFNATFEDELYDEVTDWVEEILALGYYPVVFEFQNFLSFSGPQSV